MRTYGYRGALTVLWTAGFTLALLGVLYLRWIIGIGPNASSKLFDVVIAQYAPYIGAVLGFHFAARAANRRDTKGRVVPYRLAMAMSTLWNLVVVGFVIQACLNPNLSEDAMNDPIAESRVDGLL
jgi:hypothetical protein